MEKHNINWCGTDIGITFTPERFGMSYHIELHSADRAPLPVTETGYRSNCLPCDQVAELGGAAAFVTAWLDHEAAREAKGPSQRELNAQSRWFRSSAC